MVKLLLVEGVFSERSFFFQEKKERKKETVGP